MRSLALLAGDEFGLSISHDETLALPKIRFYAAFLRDGGGPPSASERSSKVVVESDLNDDLRLEGIVAAEVSSRQQFTFKRSAY